MSNNRLLALILAGAAAYVVYTTTPAPVAPPPCPGPICPPAPPPPAPPPPPPRPSPRPGPWGNEGRAPVGAKVGGPVNEDGTEIACHLPARLHQKNRGGSDGAGLCVFASMRHSGLWQNEPVFTNLFQYMWTKPGGSYPSKTDAMIDRYCKERGATKPPYLQVEGTDLEILKAASKSGRMPGVTYSFSPTRRYGGGRISHMVSLVHADDRHFVVLDNNYIGDAAYEWMTPEEFRRTYTGGRSGWSVILLTPPFPPSPWN